MKTLVSILFGLMMWSGAATALAQSDVPVEVPILCQGKMAKRAYLNGIEQGKSLVMRAWEGVNYDCDLLEHLTDIIIANTNSYTISGTTDYVICRHTGMVDGVYQKLDFLWKLCDGLCYDEGAAIGKLAADLYCQLSALLDGLVAPDGFIRRPVFECGFEFQTGCDTTFIGTSIIGEWPNLLGEIKQCLKYTEDPFFVVWNGTRNLQCAYTLPDL